MAFFPVSIARRFLLKIFLIVSVRRWSSSFSSGLVEGAVSLVEVLLIPGFLLEGELSEDVDRVRVGVEIFYTFWKHF